MTYEKIHKFLSRTLIILSLFMIDKIYANDKVLSDITSSVDYSYGNLACDYDVDSLDSLTEQQYESDKCTQMPGWSADDVFIITVQKLTTDAYIVESHCTTGTANDYVKVNKLSETETTCYYQCDFTPSEDFILVVGKYCSDYNELITLYPGSEFECGCMETNSNGEDRTPIYRKPAPCEGQPNTHLAGTECVCNDGYSPNASGVCSPCYELVHTQTYYEQLYATTQENCILTDDKKLSLSGRYISKLFWVDCLPSCIVGITVCPQGQTTNSTNDACVDEKSPDPDETCSGWIKVSFIDNRGQTTDYYNGETLPDHCYNVYECQNDATQIKYSDVSCGAPPGDDTGTGDDTNASDPTDSENTYTGLESNTTKTFDKNVTTPTVDLNGTTGTDQAIIAKLSKINESTMKVNETLLEGFSDMKGELQAVNKTLGDGVKTVADKIGTTNNKLSDISTNLNSIEDELQSIDARLTDPMSDSDYTSFMNSVPETFSNFIGRGVLPFSSVARVVPSITVHLYGHTYSLLDASMLSSVDWSIFRGFLLFLAAISAFHRIFTNV